ncbi:PREDICTED: uncharacterized protein LOC108361902 [Rhagoletis zephyria]|uniref:uncharacterized protein LOC108361902 n=1 Tax=Rhagoletis zephyria TaxID=28612 RepID=UPI0008117584|nr:PREDICTED: uncharacterized protein LOC108361902 [Rhagoletis zephyria]
MGKLTYSFYCIDSRMGGQDLLDSLCKSISRIMEYCQHTEFKNATLEQVKVRAEKLEAYYGRFVDTHEKQLDQDAIQASTYDDIAALAESRYFTAQALLAVKIKELTPVSAAILHEQQPFAVQKTRCWCWSRVTYKSRNY